MNGGMERPFVTQWPPQTSQLHAVPELSVHCGGMSLPRRAVTAGDPLCTQKRVARAVQLNAQASE